MTRRSILIFLPAFGLGILLLAGLFTLIAGSVAYVPLVSTIVGGGIIGLLAVHILHRRGEQTDPYRRRFRWPVFVSIFFAIQASSALREWLGGTSGMIIGICTAAALGGVSAYLDQLTLPQKRKDLFPPKLLPLRWRRAAQIALWSLIAVEALIAAVSFSHRTSPCGRLDLPRWISGCMSVLRHPSAVTSISYTPDGALLAAGSSDGNVYLWSMPDAVLRRTLTGHTNWVSSVAIAPNGEIIASASWDRTIRLWRAADSTLLRTLSGHTESIWDIAFAPDGLTLASAATDGTARLWRVADGTLRATLEHPNGAQKVAFSPDGQTLAVSGGMDTLRLWNVQDGTLRNRLFAPRLIESLTFAPDGTMIAAGDWGNTIRLWRVQDGALIRTLDGHTDHVMRVAFSPDGSLLASTGDMDDRTVRVWRVADGTLARSFDLRFGADDIVFGPDGATLAIAAHDEVFLWRAK